MNEPGSVPPQGASQGLQGVAAPKPVGVGAVPPRLAGAGVAPVVQRPSAQPAHHTVGMAQPVRTAPSSSSIPVFDEDLIHLDDDATPPAAAASAIRLSPAAQLAPAAPLVPSAPVSKIRLSGGGDKHNYTKFKRAAHANGTGACRLRSFHGRLSDEGLAFMDDKINEWLDTHPEVEIKHVNSVIGPIEGKNGEQAMFVTIWY